MGHWYTRAGCPCHQIQGRNGKTRDTTLRDARTLQLCPSSTTVLGVLDKPALVGWKLQQAMMAALTLSRAPGESDDAYIERILRDSQAQASNAADEGSRIHAAIEAHFSGEPVPAQYRPHVVAVLAELNWQFPEVTDWRSEVSFASPLGYGGCVDLYSPSTGMVVDFKSKDGDFSDGKRLAYDQHRQLASYHRGLELPSNRCANIFVSRTHPGVVRSHIWTAADIDGGWSVFKCALALWQAINNYDASFAGAAQVAA